jgi:hypothetical protein
MAIFLKTLLPFDREGTASRLPPELKRKYPYGILLERLLSSLSSLKDMRWNVGFTTDPLYVNGSRFSCASLEFDFSPCDRKGRNGSELCEQTFPKILMRDSYGTAASVVPAWSILQWWEKMDREIPWLTRLREVSGTMKYPCKGDVHIRRSGLIR